MCSDTPPEGRGAQNPQRFSRCNHKFKLYYIVLLVLGTTEHLEFRSHILGEENSYFNTPKVAFLNAQSWTLLPEISN